MRYFLKTMVATAVVAGATMAANLPAFAGADEASRDSFWANQSVGKSGSPHQGAYMTVDPRDTKADSSGVNAADASNPYFNHSMGTMSAPDAVAQSQAPAATDNGRYTATYQQQYMKMDPADAKAADGAKNTDGDDPYFYHSMGTMGRP